MKFNQQIECPVSFTPINENKARIVALFIFLLSITYLFFQHWSIAIILSVDFFLRSFGFSKYSYLGWLADTLIRALSIPNKPIDSGPKKFAAGIGFIFSILVSASTVLQFNTVAVCLAAVLTLFSFLETALNICAGCYVHSFYKKLFLNADALA